MRLSLPLATTAVLVTGLAAIASTALGSPDRTAGHRSTPGPKVIATGLDNPRGLAFGAHDISFRAPGGAHARHGRLWRHGGRHHRASAYVVVGACFTPNETCG